jgi:filamentous hemagglutinin family protein
MNHAYRLIWNQLYQSWVAVSEVARGRSKGSGRTLVMAALSLSAVGAHAAPSGGKVVSGSGSISSNGATTTIVQSSSTLSVNWNSFNVAPKETVTFVQPTASSIAVNRIFDTSGTRILGKLNANGQVFLINPNGILFGKGAQVNVGGLVASTLDVSDASLASGRLKFSGNGTGSVINQGTITAANGGYVALLGNHVGNEGTIVAKLGTVALGAGSAATLNFDGNSLVSMQVDQSTLNNLAANGGLIQADGGIVLMTAGAKDALLASVVNNTGVIEARTVENHNGTITLLGGMASGAVNVGGTLDASAPDGGNGGSIETSAATVKVAPDATITTRAPHGLAGSWLIDPTDFTVAASGGDMTGTTLSAALDNGNVQLQSTSGASAGSGNVNIDDTVNWNAATTLTLSALSNININQSITASNANGKLALQYGLNAVSAGNTATYNVNAPVNLQAGNNFSTQLGSDGAVAQYTVITSLGNPGSTTGTDLQGINGNLAGNYVLGSDIDASSTSGWNSGAGFTPIGNTNGSGSGEFSGQFDGLGHAISGLVINVPASTFSWGVGLFGVVANGGVVRNVGVVGANISAGNNVDDDENYAGGLAGINYGTIVNSHTSGTVAGGYGGTGGLVGASVGTISNSYSTASVSIGNDVGDDGLEDQRMIGGLVGYNLGTISNSYATGSVSASTPVDDFDDFGTMAGGLVGLNESTVSNSYATGSVTLNSSSGEGTAAYAGGLVGLNESTVSNSYATGSVTVNSSSGESTAAFAGGLVGLNESTVSNSYATGSVTVNSSSGVDTATFAGGLVGFNEGTVSNSYATGSVTTSGVSDGSVNAGGLIGINDDGGTVSNSFWDTDTSGLSTSSGGTGLSTQQMQSQSNFTAAGWDFANTWVMYEGYTYPLLRSFMSTLTVTVNDASKTYDGTGFSGGNGVTYSVTPNENLMGTLAYGGTSQGATDVNASGYTISASGLYSGQQGYIIVYQDGTLTIDPKTLTVSGTSASNKVYDGTTAATLTGGTLSGLIGSDANTVTLTQSGTFASKNVGTGIDVSATDTLGGAGAGNYVIEQPTGLTANITPATLTVSGTSASNKVYDGTTAAALTGGTLTGVIGSDTVTLTQSGTFATKNVGTGIGVTASDTLGGADAGNYVFAQPTGLSANITPATLTVSGTSAGDKVYDGTTAATLTGGTLSGLFGSDTVTLAQSGTFASKNVSNGIGVTATDTLGGADAGNYVIAQPTGLSANITPATLTVSGTSASNKVYDGTTAATLTGGTLTGLFGSDTVTLTQSGTFATKNVGMGIGVTASDTLGGTDAGNYVIAQPTGLSASITPATLTVSGTSASNKVYDGTTAATLTGGTLSGVIGSDTVTLTQSGTFASKNVGTGVGVTAADTLGGADAGNYVFAQPTGLSANITPATLTVSGTSAGDKVYDGTTAAALTGGTLTGLFGSDTVTLAQSGTFASKNVGNGIGVSATDTLGGADAGNYVFAQPTGLSANITPATLTYTATPTSGQAGSPLPTLSGTVGGFVGGDTLANATSGNLAWTTSANTSSSAGSYAIDGAGLTAANYVFTEAPANETALTITAAPLQVTPNQLAITQSAFTGTGSAPEELNTSSTITVGSAPNAPSNPPPTSPTDGQPPTQTSSATPIPTLTLDIGGTGKLQIQSFGVNLPSDTLIGQN